MAVAVVVAEWKEWVSDAASVEAVSRPRVLWWERPEGRGAEAVEVVLLKVEKRLEVRLDVTCVWKEMVS